MSYVLVNKRDPGLYYVNSTTETRDLSQARRYATRRLAEKVDTDEGREYIPMFTSRLLESITPATDERSLHPRIESVLMELKDSIDSSILKVAQIVPDSYLSSEEYKKSNLAELVQKLEKTRLYLVDLAFRPSFLTTTYIPPSDDKSTSPTVSELTDGKLSGVGTGSDGVMDSTPATGQTLGSLTGATPIEAVYADTPASGMIAADGITEDLDNLQTILYHDGDRWSEVEDRIKKVVGDLSYKVITKGIPITTPSSESGLKVLGAVYSVELKNPQE